VCCEANSVAQGCMPVLSLVFDVVFMAVLYHV
jgi:hypothetical protein